MTDKIEVQDGPARDGELVTVALVGSKADLFEIRKVSLMEFHYLVNEVVVTREVYLDAMATAERDRYCPSCDGELDEPSAASEPS